MATATGSDGAAGALLIAYLGEQRAAIRAAEPGVRAGDADAIHDMRVAARRLRATLRTFRPLFDHGRTEPLRGELRWLGRLLGAVRDADVLAERLAAAIEAEPRELIVGPVAARIRQRLADDVGPAREALTAGLNSERYAALLAELDRVAAGAAGPTDTAGPRRLRRRAKRALRRADRRLAAAVSPAEADPRREAGDRDTRLHDARKAYKRARYAAEAIAVLAGGPARRLVKRLKALQDVLGAHQDATVARDLLHEHGLQAHRDGDNAFTYGVLHARQHAHGQRALAGLDRARRRAGKRKVRRWLTK